MHYLFYAPIVIGKYIRRRYKINSVHFFVLKGQLSSHRPILLPSNSKYILNFANMIIHIIIKILKFNKKNNALFCLIRIKDDSLKKRPLPPPQYREV